MNTKIMDGLKALGACPEALRWAEKQKGPGLAWKSCARGDWMLWLLGRKACPAWSDSRKPLVLAACECARLALPYTKDPRVLKCIETAEAWTRGEATVEEARKAQDAAYAAARKMVLKQCADIVRKHYPKAPRLLRVERGM